MSALVKADIEKRLTGVSNGYFPMGYVSEALLPTKEVSQQTGKIGAYGKDHLRIVNTIMGGAGEARRVNSFTTSDQSYYIEDHGLSDIVTVNDRRNYDAPFDAEKDKTIGLTHLLWMAKEFGLASALTSTSTMTQNETLSGAAQFSDYANSDPLGKFSTARRTIRNACGMAPNAVIMSWQVADKLAYHPAILDALGFTQNRAGQLTEAELAKAMGVRRLFIADVMYNSAVLGQTDSLTDIWGRDVIFFVRPDRADLRQQSLGYYLKYKGERPRQVYKNPIKNPPNATEVIVTDNHDFMLTDVTCGYLIKDAISA